MEISKSKFVAGCQCLKRLYWQVHAPELAAEPNAADEAIIEQGQEVGLLARQLFPGGVEVDGSRGLEQAIQTTRELIANPEIPAIFEGTFENSGVVVRTDILRRRRDRRWRLPRESLVEIALAGSCQSGHVALSGFGHCLC